MTFALTTLYSSDFLNPPDHEKTLKMQQSHTLGIDFGTSNSAAGFMQGNTPRLVEFAQGQSTLPTAFFFDFATRETLIGQAANSALIDGLEGRYMRALKRVLGKPVMHEKRRILNETVTFVDIIARFLAEIKQRAEAASGHPFDNVLSGRPVHFHDEGAALDAKAEDDLRQCYLAAGFKQVRFIPEPEAAAISVREPLAKSTLGLVVDIGGGTSDFSLFESVDGGVNIIASHGIRIGGTDFDRAISIKHVMPLLGKGAQLRKHLGAGMLAAPNAIFNDLATWEKIPFLYGSDTTRMVAEMHMLAVEPAKFKRLVTVLEFQLGHDIAFAVEQGKIDANNAKGQAVCIKLGVLEPALVAGLSTDALNRSIASDVAAITACALETLQMADVPKDRVGRIVFVGGSSLTSAVTTALSAAFPDAECVYSQVFTAVTNGLAIAAQT